MSKSNKRIVEVRVERMTDEDPDSSYLGKYSHTPGPGAIDREKRGDMGRHEYRYWNPANWDMSLPAITRNIYRKRDYERCEALNRNEWWYIGIRARARVEVRLGAGEFWKADTLTSGGLWGIESDSDDSYLREVGDEQLAELREILAAYGFGKRDIDRAIKGAHREENI